MAIPTTIDDIFSLENSASVSRTQFNKPLQLSQYPSLQPFEFPSYYTSESFYIQPEQDTLDVRARVAEICKQGRSIGKHEKFETAVMEAFRNAYQHGNKKDPTKKVTLSYQTTPTFFEVVVSDEGGSFNPDFTPFVLLHRQGLKTPYSFYQFSRTTTQSSENSGIGTFLMHALADEVHYLKNSSGGLSVQLIIKKH